MSRIEKAKTTAAVALHNAGWALGREAGARIAASVSDALIGGHIEASGDGRTWCLTTKPQPAKPTKQN